jgi:hypothetical protein
MNAYPDRDLHQVPEELRQVRVLLQGGEKTKVQIAFLS